MRSLAALALVGLASVSVAQDMKIGVKSPKLVVFISIDQFRGDYLARYNPYFLPAQKGKTIGGFRFLTETGSWYRDAYHNHIPTETGPGHATLLTGSEPVVNGIWANDWFNQATGKDVYCVEDPKAETVGGKSSPMSPFNLKVTTVADELKMATNGKSKVVSLAFKDRAAILMAGHAADDVVWFDNGTGNWVTSTWYAPNKQLPAWAAKLNSERLIDKAAGTTWEPLLDSSVYGITRPAPRTKPGNGKPFSYKLPTTLDNKLWGSVWTSQVANEFTEESAERALAAQQLGKHDVPDMLIVGLSSNDTIGHAFGPNSAEVMDITIRTDRLLSKLFNAIDKQVGINNVVIALSGDHGVVPIPEEAVNVFKVPIEKNGADKAIAAALTAKYGEGKWVLAGGQEVHLNRPLIAEKKLDIAEVERVAQAAALTDPGIAMVFTRTQLLSGLIPNVKFAQRVANGYSPANGGDLVVLTKPGYYSGGGGTGHGSVWDYDAHVPIVFRGPGIAKGVFSREVHTSDIAPTFSYLLGIEMPSGNLGSPLHEALGGK